MNDDSDRMLTLSGVVKLLTEKYGWTEKEAYTRFLSSGMGLDLMTRPAGERADPYVCVKLFEDETGLKG